MKKYLTSKEVCERFDISKSTLYRWETKSPYGIPFPKPVLSCKGSVKRYLYEDVIKWEDTCASSA